MIPYDIDPSLHDSEPEPQELGDGFSPPTQAQPEEASEAHLDAAAEAAFGEKSPF